MALYQPVQSWMKASEAVKIIGTEQGDGFTVYRVQVTIPPYCWVAKHRYSDFKELHNKASMVLPDVSVQRCSSVQLRRNYHVERSLLPPGKVLGRQAASFVQQRQAELEHYLVTLVHHFADGLPLPLARFLHFDQFEVRTVVADLAEQLFETGEQTLAGDSRFCTTPLQLHCLTERLKLAEPTCSSEDKRRDLAHVLDFVSQLRHLDVVAEPGCLGASSVRPSCLPFDLSPFRSLRTLRLQGCEVRGQLSGLEVLRPHLRELAVESALSPMADLSCILVAGDIWQAAAWPQVQRACFNRNGLHTIDLSVRLLTSVEHLELLGNKLSKVENLECLSRLSTLNMAENSLRQLPPLHTRLGNVRQLILAGNQIDSLAEGGAPELSGPLMDKRPDAAADEFRKQVATMRTLGGTDWLRLFNRMSQQQQTTQQLNPVQPAQSLPAAPSGSDCEKPIGELALPDWLLRTGLQQPSFQDQLQAQAKGLAPEWVAWCTRVEAPTVATTVVCIVANCTGLNLLELEQVQGSSGAVVPQFGQCTTIAPSRIERLLRGPHRSYIELRTELQSRASGTLLLPATAEEADDLMRKFAATFGLECRDKFAPAHVECVAAGAMSAADVRYCGRMLSNGADAGMIHYVLVVRKEIVVVVEDTFGVVQPFRVEQTWNVALPVVDVQLPEHWPASVASVDEFRKCGFGVRISFEGGQQFEARFQVRDSRSQFLEAFLAARNS
ncbi:uncharacterized protein LOC142567838 isoform X5 [Dermacentor variabilis]|uniref:uncharacterized protein LOC142567838 isoform X5 n=1 Tax=Dermacentor variabilis TaxID=34621 RepID=UPI003F5C49B5